MEFVKRAWRGEEKLWKVFWLYGYAVPIAFGLIIVLPIMLILGIATPQLLSVFTPIMDFYYLAWIVCVFRCSQNVKEKSWSIAARIWAALVLLRVIFEVISHASKTMYH